MLLASLAFLSFSSLKYAVFIDAGSSGTRYNLFQWEGTDSFPAVSVVPGSANPYKSPIRLSDAATNSSVIPSILDDFILSSSQQLPAQDLSSTRVIAYATAGMRMLDDSTQNRVMSDFFFYLRVNSPYRVKKSDVRVITGAEEGLFGWVAVNSLLGGFDGGAATIFSEMGGASTQIAIPATSSENMYSVQINGAKHDVFVFSYLGYGSDQALATVTGAIANGSHPCMNAGYAKGTEYVGTGNWSECVGLIESALLKNPGFAAVKLASMAGIREFYGISVFAYIVDDIREPENITLARFRDAALDFAALNWTQVQQQYGAADTNVWLFDLAFVYTLLTKGFNLSDDSNEFHFCLKIGGTTIGYSLGGMIAQLWDLYFEEKGKISLLASAIVNGLLLVALVGLVVVYAKPCQEDAVPAGLLWN
jgi:Golgi nucleoside diphosphatase